jgi:hypothetical protein
VERTCRDEPDHIRRAIMHYGLLRHQIEREIRKLTMRRDEL